ncbi:mitochondrial ribonuclease P protein 1 homolog [Oppia nitens]|uniref:mitochondrial ribonuclease P protein 1 homolog n=1 Tax=Oppia nitens TaxID=1686743 RepID=UPI0023DC5B9D|nr:mitochondrial ribonuclease P protein 1 homolog [Oppia nitens]
MFYCLNCLRNRLRSFVGINTSLRQLSVSSSSLSSSSSTTSVNELVANNDNFTIDQLLDIPERDFVAVDINTFSDVIVDYSSGGVGGGSGCSSDFIKRRVQLIISEYEYKKLTDGRVPRELTDQHMRELLDLDNSAERCRQLQFWGCIEIKRLKTRHIRAMKAQSSLSCPTVYEKKPIGIFGDSSGSGEEQLVYGPYRNGLFQFFNRSAVKRLRAHCMRRAAMFGPRVVIDLDFDRYMKARESRLLLKQLNFLYNYNLMETKEPFDLHFVNCNSDELSIREMHRYLPNASSRNFWATFHYNKSYTDIFPKERLVYLSPHSDSVLREVSDDDIYIIGGIIDKSYIEPISQIKAREDGIRSAKLPLTETVKWQKGTLNLCINQVLAILHDWKITGNWELAIKRNVPSRKWMSTTTIDDNDIIDNKKLMQLKTSLYV